MRVQADDAASTAPREGLKSSPGSAEPLDDVRGRVPGKQLVRGRWPSGSTGALRVRLNDSHVLKRRSPV